MKCAPLPRGPSQAWFRTCRAGIPLEVEEGTAAYRPDCPWPERGVEKLGDEALQASDICGVPIRNEPSAPVIFDGRTRRRSWRIPCLQLSDTWTPDIGLSLTCGRAVDQDPTRPRGARGDGTAYRELRRRSRRPNQPTLDPPSSALKPGLPGGRERIPKKELDRLAVED